MKMLTEIGKVENVEPYIHGNLENKEKIMGFGHRVYRKGDPRAKHLKEMSENLTKFNWRSQMCMICQLKLKKW